MTTGPTTIPVAVPKEVTSSVCSRLNCVLALVASVVAVSLTLDRPSEDWGGGRGVCSRSPKRAFGLGNVIEIGDDGPAPCRIEFHPTGVRLEAVADGSRPDPGRTVVVDTDGRFISANAHGMQTVISVWDARGRYMSSFGGDGEGPGEFPARYGMLNLLMDDRGRLHIRDGSPAWSLFSPEHRFVRRVPANVMGGLTGSTVILDGGSALASDGILSNRSHYFRVTDSTGLLERAFGPVGDGEVGREMRPITYHGGDTFWAAPGENGAEDYLLEEWGTDGQLRRSIRRDVSWWRWRGEIVTSTRVRQVHIVRNGLLYVVVRRPSAEYLRVYERTRTRSQSLSELAEYVVEVIDTRSGELLASEVYSQSQRHEIVPRSLFRGSLVGYRYKVGDDGLPFVEIVTAHLVAR